MKDKQRYSKDMRDDDLRAWAADAQAELDIQHAEIKRLRAALEEIKMSPGGGPGKRIAYQALDEGEQ